MRSASITRRNRRIIIHPWSTTVSGLGIGTNPILVLEVNEDPEKIGEAIVEALAAVQVGLPHPDPSEWADQDKQFFEAAGVRSWSEFVRGAVASGIIAHEDRLEFLPKRNLGSRGGFQESGLTSLKIPVDSDFSTIGKTAIESLELAESTGSMPSVPADTMAASSPDNTKLKARATVAGTKSEDSRKLMAKLDRLGFFRFVKAEDREQARKVILEHGWTGIFGENGRLFLCDAEDLAEGGVSAFIAEVTPFLELQGVAVPTLEDDFGEEYFLITGGERIPIWTHSENKRDASDMPGLCWGLSSARTVRILNDWLAKANSPERAYGVNGANDFAVFFLTPELHERICRDPEASPRNCPYVPTLDYPLFGQQED